MTVAHRNLAEHPEESVATNLEKAEAHLVR
jgi:hypothetical protein